MPAKRPNRETVLHREAEAWGLRCRGWMLKRIADHMSLSIEGVRKILARVEERESKRLSKNVHRVKARQNGQLEHVIEEGFDAWHTSKEPKRRAVRKASGEGEEQQVVEHTEATDQCGDPRYLHLVLAAHEAQRELTGLNNVTVRRNHTPPARAAHARTGDDQLRS